MNIRVLGCSGGIGLGFHTSSYLVNDRILLDAGTGLSQLPLECIQQIDHVLLSHSHMDHIACLPMLLEARGHQQAEPLTVWALPETIMALQQHIFNDVIWPDFSRLPSSDHPFLRYRLIESQHSFQLEGIDILPIAVAHSVPTLAFAFTGQSGKSFVISGDTGCQDDFWQHLLAVPNLQGLAIETAFSDDDMALAQVSGHLSPCLLLAELEKLPMHVPVYIMHLKPEQSGRIQETLLAADCRHSLHFLQSQQLLEIH